MSANELNSRATPRMSSLVSSDKPAFSSSVGALLVRALGAGLADASPPPRKDGRKRPSPVFAPDFPAAAAGLAAPGALLPPKRPKGDEPPVLGVAGLAPPTVGLVPVARVPPKGDELAELELAGADGFLSSALAPPPKRLVMPPNNPPDLASVLALGVAGLSAGLAPPPPKRLVIPPRLLVIPPNGLLDFSPLLALGVAGLSSALAPPPPKRLVMPPSTPPDFFSSGLLVGLAGLLAGLLPPAGGAELAAGRLPPKLDDPPELAGLLGLLDPLELPPKVDPAGRAGADDPAGLVGDEPGLLPAGRLPLPNGDDPPEPDGLLGLLDPLELLPKDDPPPGGRLPLPNVPPDPPELPPGEVGLLPAGRLPPKGETLPPLVGLAPGVAGRLTPAGALDEPNVVGRAPDGLEPPPPGTGLVRAPDPGKPVVGRLPRVLVPPKGFTRD